ncbi:MAG: nucleoside hydrolase [Candidatus Limivicinus sp.]|nr:nucleoside hydrolase [Candidatus Limivicinus sp.]
MKKVLLDFDIGTEIDDAIALAYLLENPECELVGITTSCGEAVKRAEMASMLCKIAGKDVPIHPGAETPLIVPQMEARAPQAVVVEQYDHETDFEPNSAIPFMQKIIHDNPGEITLLATAPMTNLALLFAMDPQIPELLDGIYLLCGSPTHRRYDNVTEQKKSMDRSDLVRDLASMGVLENNSIVDPHATHITYQAKCKKFVNICNNVSSRVTMTPEEAEKKFTHPVLKAVYDIAKEWFKDEAYVSFHDPVAAVCIFNDDVCTFKKGTLDVVLDNQLLAGMTIFEESENGPHDVAWTIDEKLFFQHLFEVFD